MKLPKSWSRRNIPEDLWPEILCRLPVKTLLRFRCVSKSWRALIDDPDFARSHLHRFSKNRGETHLLDLDGPLRQNNLQVRCTQSLKVTARLPFPLTIDDGDGWCALSFVDGLFMLHRYMYKPLTTPELMLWNPATRKTLTLPPSHKTPTLTRYVNSGRVVVVDFGLGFDPFFKDYKHVRVFKPCPEGGIHSIAVYSLATNSWKMIEGKNQQCPQLSIHSDSALCLKGVLFHIGTTKINVVALELVSFDLRSETIDSTELPVEESWHRPLLTVADDGCSLALLSLSYEPEGSRSIWVLEGLGADGIKSWTWSKRYTFASKLRLRGWVKLFYFMQNGELLLQWQSMMTSYNLNTHKEKIIVRKNVQSTAAWPYMESLLPLN